MANGANAKVFEKRLVGGNLRADANEEIHTAACKEFGHPCIEFGRWESGLFNVAEDDGSGERLGLCP